MLSLTLPTIAPARPYQIPGIAALFEAQLLEHGIDRPARKLVPLLLELAERPQHGFILCATCNGTVVGVAYAPCILSLEHCGWSGWLEELYVLPQWRGNGIGSRLLDAIIAGAKERQWVALDLEVDAGHQRAIPLYASRGFQSVARDRFARRLDADSQWAAGVGGKSLTPATEL
ncbi:MAG TPA: GNAT family N-acetyltransferase [Chthoniobacter sp.]|nr:GNAT family N-acetyltransferase [Chthoniobacter sp.]